MKKVYALILLVVFISSCEVTAPVGGSARAEFETVYNQYVIHIDSDPQGAIIEWDNNYIGKTPFDYTVNGGMGDGVYVTLKATPTESGQYTQTKVLHNPLPNNIYFVMTLVPTEPTYNINVNH